MKSTLIKFVVKFAILFLIFWGILKAFSGDTAQELSEMPIWKAALLISLIAAIIDFACDKLIPANSKVGQFLRY